MRIENEPCWVALAVALLLAPGCTPSETAADAGFTSDARPPVDAWIATDGSDLPFDGGPPDSGESDAAADAGIEPDTGTGTGEDAATADAGGGVITTIHVRYAGQPGAIYLRGSGGPLSWTSGVALSDLGGSIWELRTTEITAPIELKALLDDTEWSRGPNYHVEPGASIEIAPHFVATNGEVTVLEAAFSSAGIASPRVVWAYLPPGYAENTAATWPVIYAQDGQNLFDPSLAFGGVEWEVDETLDAAAELGHCGAWDGPVCANDGECAGARCDTFHEAIVLGIANTAERIDEYTPSVDPTYGGGNADAYLSALEGDLAPIVASRLRARSGPASTAILGSSLGGLLAAHASVARADFFGLIVAMSPSTWWNGTAILGEIPTIPSHPSRPLRVYVDSGNAGTSQDDLANTAMLAAAYEAAGYPAGGTLRYVVGDGHTHNELYWALRLPGALEHALGPREEPIAP